MANIIKYIPSQSGELSLQWVADEFTRISNVLNEGLTIEDEGVILETSADTLNFVGGGVVASGTGSEKTITISAGGGSDLTIKDEGSALPTAATTLDFVGAGVDATGTGAEKTITISSGVMDHGALTGLTPDDDHTQYLNKDITRNVTVGYTTDVEADLFSDPFVPVITLEHFKTATVTSSFTLSVPTGGGAATGGHCEYYLSVTGTGPYTMTAGSGVQFMDTNVTLTVGKNYILNIHRYSSTNAVAQLQELP